MPANRQHEVRALKGEKKRKKEIPETDSMKMPTTAALPVFVDLYFCTSETSK
jgi:hypothetical protein